MRGKGEPKNFKLKMAVAHTIFICMLLVVSTLLTTLFAMLVYGTGLFSQANPWMNFLIFAFTTVLTGTLLARITVTRAMNKVLAVNDAAKKVANGDFSQRLEEHSHMVEMRELLRNFNLMSEELSRMEMFRSDFIENVSHEFKTPISVIEGYATLLQSPNLDEQTKRLYTEKIITNTRKLSGLTGNILLLSKVENQGIAEMGAPFLLDEQMREVILMFDEAWEEKNISLDVDLMPIHYRGNKDLLWQVWQNLIGNAIKFVHMGGEVRVSLQADGEELVAKVEDNGIGMSEEAIGRIFEKFYQADASRACKGHGLGLALVKRIVEMHGGHIDVVSQQGAGSCFCVRLPYEACEKTS